MNKLIQNIENALNNTDIGKSKIDEYILKMMGMSGKKTTTRDTECSAAKTTMRFLLK